MKNLLIISLLIISSNALSQISDASFFPSMKSINPGITHMRKQGFLAVDASKEVVDRHQDVLTGGIKDGIQYDLELDKKSFFRAGKGGGFTVEALIDKSEGKLNQSFEDLVGKVDSETTANSTYMAGIIDTSFFGIMLGKASYEYQFYLEADEIPNLVIHDHDWKIDYNVMKLGTVFRFGKVSVGAFYLSQDSKGSVDFSYYNPDDGVKGSTENYPISTETKGYGIGIGYTTNVLHVEVSQEQITSQKLVKGDDFPWDVDEQPKSSRFTLVAETKLKWFAIGLRYREIAGNFYDLEDVISAKLLYDELGKTDTRTDTTFNFSFGSSKGLTYSAFYSQGDVKSVEPVNILDNGEVYPTVTKSEAYGINISYIY